MNRDLEWNLMFTPGVAEYEAGYWAGWVAAEQHYAERSDALDATWRHVQRRTWDEQVAERVAEYEKASTELPRRNAEYVARNAEHDARILAAVGIGDLARTLTRRADVIRAVLESAAA